MHSFITVLEYQQFDDSSLHFRAFFRQFLKYTLQCEDVMSANKNEAGLNIFKYLTHPDISINAATIVVQQITK